MQTTLAIPAHESIGQATVQQIAATYTAQHIGKSFSAAEPHFLKEPQRWSFLVQRRIADLARPVACGRLFVDACTGKVIPLNRDEILDIQERSLLLAGRQRGEKLIYSEDGLILAYQAKIKANLYASNQIAFFASADGRPRLIPCPVPVWRVAIVLRLPQSGLLSQLGSIDINAHTGEVLPLSCNEIQTLQQQAQDAALAPQHSPTAGI